jgi:hypothetical protein
MSAISIIDLVPEVGQIVRRCPTLTLTRAYLRAARNFCAQTRWLRADATLVGGPNTIANVAIYDLQITDPALEIVGVRDVKGAQVGLPLNSWIIRPLDKTLFSPWVGPGSPTKYAYIPDAKITFFPTPEKAYAVNIVVAVQPVFPSPALIPSATLPSELITKWKEVIEAGALEYLFGIPEQKWSNANSAVVAGKAFRAGINNAKGDEQRGYNQGPVRARPRQIIFHTWR